MKKWLFVVLLALLVLPVTDVRAGVVQPYGKDEWGYYDSDSYSIMYELEETGYAKLVKGKTYYIGSSIDVYGNMKLDATGATIIVADEAVRNDGGDLKKGYDSMSNITVIGGKWISESKNGNPGTSFSFSHAKNITLKNMDIRCASADGHGVEFVSCKNVVMKNCKVIAQGKGRKNSVEESVQFDFDTKTAAPYLNGRGLHDGTPCKNVTIDHCTIKGCRGLCASFPSSEKKYWKKYHDKIVVKNCTITGTKAEALALFNANNVTVKNNKIISKSHRVNQAYSIGCHLALFGKIKAFSKGKNVVTGNTIKGGRQGFQMCSHTKSRYGKLTIKNNKCYSKKGKANALKITVNASGKRSAIRLVKKGNKLRKW